tara:strand:+ start:678 stop:1058 length:381 start_codon:yes stop_codon:yes gene_type:complete
MFEKSIQFCKLIVMIALSIGLFKVVSVQEYQYTGIDNELMMKMDKSFLSLSDNMLLLIKINQSEISTTEEGIKRISEIKSNISVKLKEISEVLMIMSQNNSNAQHFQDYQLHYNRWKAISEQYDNK